MEDGKYLTGPRARIGDREYKALHSDQGPDFICIASSITDGPQPGLEWSTKHGQYVADVHLSEVDAYYRSRREFKWRGRWFVLDKIENGLLFGTLLEGNDAWARENGLVLIDRAWAVGKFSQDEVENPRRSNRLPRRVERPTDMTTTGGRFPADASLTALPR